MFVLTNHPAVAKDSQGNPLLDEFARPVPLFPDQRAVRMKQDNMIVAYVAPAGKWLHVSVIAKPGVYHNRLTEDISEFVASELGKPCRTSAAVRFDEAVKAYMQADGDDDDE